MQKPNFHTLKNRYRHLSLSAGWTHLFNIFKSVCILFLAISIGFAFRKCGFDEISIYTVFILGILIIAVITASTLYSTLSSILGVLLFNFFFAEPIYSFKASNYAYPMTFVTLFIASFIMGSITSSNRRQVKMAAESAARTQILLETEQLLQKTKSAVDVTRVTANRIAKLTDRSVIFYSAAGNLLLPPLAYDSAADSMVPAQDVSDTEQSQASEFYIQVKDSSNTCDYFSTGNYFYLPVKTATYTYGIIGIDAKAAPPSRLDISLATSILGECALAFEKELYSQKREEAAIQAENERLRANLLRSISHDLRTPLTSISGNAGILLNRGQALTKQKKESLCRDIYSDSIWLINLVENLLAVTRIEDNRMDIRMQPELLDEIIVEALQHVGHRSTEHYINFVPTDDLLLAKIDARLVVQVIINIVDNAIKYTPAGSHITISAEKADDQVIIEIADDGDGIPDTDKKKLFDMFYTVPRASADGRRGLGLGLALCRSIIKAHGGTISVRDNIPHGTIFTFALHAEEVQINE